MHAFERATKSKLRFTTSQGRIFSVEDLWELPLASLDDIAKGLHKALEDNTPVSFIGEKVKADTKQQLRFDVVKRVIEVRLADAKRAEKAAKTRERNQRIMELIAQKDDEALAGKSKKELKKLLSEVEEDEE